MPTINTTTDLIRTAAEAARFHDFTTLYELLEINAGWMQTEDERNALKSMVEAFIQILEDQC